MSRSPRAIPPGPGTRGLTMIEVLAALALFGVVALVCGAWLRTATATGAAVSPVVRWRSACDAVLTLIEDDLRSGDLRGESPRRVEVADGVLRLRTRGAGDDRDPGPVLHEYRLRAASGELERRESGSGGPARTRALLDGVAAWRCEIGEDGRFLVVEIDASHGERRSRRWELRP